MQLLCLELACSCKSSLLYALCGNCYLYGTVYVMFFKSVTYETLFQLRWQVRLWKRERRRRMNANSMRDEAPISQCIKDCDRRSTSPPTITSLSRLPLTQIYRQRWRTTDGYGGSRHACVIITEPRHLCHNSNVTSSDRTEQRLHQGPLTSHMCVPHSIHTALESQPYTVTRKEWAKTFSHIEWMLHETPPPSSTVFLV